MGKVIKLPDLNRKNVINLHRVVESNLLELRKYKAKLQEIQRELKRIKAKQELKIVTNEQSRKNPSQK